MIFCLIFAFCSEKILNSNSGAFLKKNRLRKTGKTEKQSVYLSRKFYTGLI